MTVKQRRKLKSKQAEEPLRAYITPEKCPACGEGGMGATARHLNCFACGFQRELEPQEIRTYTRLLLHQERLKG